MNLADSQNTENQNGHNGASRRYKKEELVDLGILFCVQSASKVTSQYGYQWQVGIEHQDGWQYIWFVGCNPTDRNAKLTAWDKIFTKITEWPNHSYRLTGERGKPGGKLKYVSYTFVVCPEDVCPCQLSANMEEVQEILAETMGDNAPASPAQMAALATMCKALRVEYVDVAMTVAEWRNNMNGLIKKQAGVPV